MALPLNRPSNPINEEPDEELLIKKPVRPGFLNLPDELRDEVEENETPQSANHSSFRGESLDREEESLEEAIAIRRAQFGTASNGLNKNDFQLSTVLTSDDLIENPWERYEKLMPKLEEVKAWLQEVLSEQGLSTDIAEARSKRGKKYQEMKELIDRLLARHFAEENIIQGREGGLLMTLVTNEMLGLGMLEPLWQDPRISEIMVNGPYSVYVEMKGKILPVPGAQFRTPEHLLDVCQQILAPIGRVIDNTHSRQDGRLSDGSRVNMVHPVLAPAGPLVTIRRFSDTNYSLQKLVEAGAMTSDVAELIGNYVYHGLSVVIAGGTGSGKTTTLNALSGCIPGNERIITIEDSLELQLNATKHVVAMEARPPKTRDDDTAVSIRDLVKNALRQRPDRIVVGEVRDSSAYDMLQSMNTGHDGSLTTVHANDAFGTIERLINLITEAGEVDANRAVSLIAGGVDIIVTIERYEDGSRRTSGIYEVPTRPTVGISGTNEIEPITIAEFIQDGLDDDDMVIGHYEFPTDKKLSDKMIKKHRYNKKQILTLEELYAVDDSKN
jgi:pilus assembly protein CpaF